MPRTRDDVLDLRRPPEPKYTRGEHCIYVNLVLTFAVLTGTVGVYLVHVYAVRHTPRQALRYAPVPVRFVMRNEEPEYWPLSAVSADASGGRRVLCHGVLLRAAYTAAPAHCVTLHRHPRLAHLKSSWRVTYALNSTGHIEVGVQASVTHPAFSADDLQHNVGLLQHDAPVSLGADEYLARQFLPMTDLYLKTYAEEIYMIGLSVLNTSADWPQTISKNLAQWIPRSNCSELVAKVAALRHYEFCLAFPTPRAQSLYPGEAVVLRGRIVGMVSWGDSGARGVPFVVLNLLYYDAWFTDTISGTLAPRDDNDGPTHTSPYTTTTILPPNTDYSSVEEVAIDIPSDLSPDTSDY